MKANAWKAGAVVDHGKRKDLKIGELLVRSRSIKNGPSLVAKSYVGCSNQFS